MLLASCLQFCSSMKQKSEKLSRCSVLKFPITVTSLQCGDLSPLSPAAACRRGFAIACAGGRWRQVSAKQSGDNSTPARLPRRGPRKAPYSKIGKRIYES
jgi:hypothetical protein